MLMVKRNILKIQNLESTISLEVVSKNKFSRSVEMKCLNSLILYFHLKCGYVLKILYGII